MEVFLPLLENPVTSKFKTHKNPDSSIVAFPVSLFWKSAESGFFFKFSKMRRITFILLAVIITSCSKTTEYSLTLKNPATIDQMDAGIILTADMFSKLPDGKIPVIEDPDGNLFPSQADDLDGDGKWDEIFLLANLEAGAEKKAFVRFLDPEGYPDLKARTNIRFANKKDGYIEVSEATRETHADNLITQEIWQMEGIAWENDYIAFRNYFDQRNGMDIFGKVTTNMVLDHVGDAENPEYHAYNPDWGVDVLKVGNSLGAGGIAMLYNDSLYRIGDNGEGLCKVIVDGPLRSIFRFTFNNWKMADQELTVIHDVTITAGTHYYSSKVSYTGSEAPMKLVTGIVNKKSHELLEAGQATDYPAFYTFDLQAEDTTLLGMGLLIPKSEFIETFPAPKEGSGITETYCVSLNIQENTSVDFRFYAVWEREDDRWKTAQGFGDFLAEEAIRASSPVTAEVALSKRKQRIY